MKNKFNILKRFFFRVLKNGLLESLFSLNGNRTAVLLYRVGNTLYKYHIPEIPYIFSLFNFFLNSIEINYRAVIGKKFFIGHANGIVIGRTVKIGDYCKIYSGVVIGNKTEGSGMPQIGDNVTIGSGSKILGNIKVGHNVIIGANSTVIHDIPNNCTVVGSPARIIKNV